MVYPPRVAAMRIAFLHVHDRFTPFSTATAAISGAVRDLGHEHVLCGIELGTTVDGAVERLSALRPELVAASFMSRDFLPISRVVREVRARTGAYTVAGGYHATLDATGVAAAGAFDAIGIGEGERAFRRVVEAVGAGGRPETSPGLWAAQRGVFVGGPPPSDREPDIAALPPWDYELFGDVVTRSSMHGYVLKDRFAPLRASRGCPFDCTYCSNPAWKQVNELDAGGARNVRPVEQVIEEACRLAERFGAEGFEFWDEHFPVDVRWIAALAEAWPARVGLPFRVEMHPNTATPERLALLAKAGCVLMQYGVEAGDERLRRSVLKRRTSDAAYERVFAATRALGMATSASVMLAMPGETYEMGLASLALIRRLRPDYMSYAAYAPLPRTELGARARLRRAASPDLFHGSFTAFEPQIEPDAMTVDEARSLLRAMGELQAEIMSRAKGEEAVSPAAREAVSAALGEAWSVRRVTQEPARRSLTLELRRAERPLTVELRAVSDGAPHYVRAGALAISYRGDALLAEDDAALRALAAALGSTSLEALVEAWVPS